MSQGDQDRSSSYTESMAAKDEIPKCLVGDLGEIIAFSVSPFKSCGCPLQLKLWTIQGGLMPVVIAIFLSDSFNSKVTHPTVLLDSLVAKQRSFSPPTYVIWPILNRLQIFSFAIALISVVCVWLSLRSNEDHPTWRDPYYCYQVTLLLYFGALHKLLFDIDFPMIITVAWWIGFISVIWHYLALSRAVAQTMRELLA